MDFTFSGTIFYWRGPSPFHFVTVPAAECRELAEAAPFISYGWGCIPATVQIGQTTFTTSLFPKDGAYLVPIKAHVRKTEGLDLDDKVTMRLLVGEI